MRPKIKDDSLLTRRTALQFGVIALLVLGALGFGGWRWLQSWRYDKAIRDTEDYLRLGDPRSAAFAAKRAAGVRPDSVTAARMLAEALERTGSVESVIWRKKVVDLAPGDWRDHLAFAAGAMKFRDPHLASTALEKVSGEGRQHIDFHRTGADIALALGNKVDAETHLAECVRLDPYDGQRRLHLAVIRLASPETEKAMMARAQLEEFKDDPQFRLQALRVLVREATREQVRPALRLNLSTLQSLTESPLANDPRLKGLAGELLAEETATVDDCMLGLEVLWLMRDPTFSEKMSRLETAKYETAAELGDAMLWMTSRNAGAKTLDWYERMPDELRGKPEVQLAITDAWLLQKEWGMVQAIVEETEWGDFETERLVLSTIAWRESGDPQRSNASWSLAELRLGQTIPRIRRLAELTARWGAEPEKEKLWWALTQCQGDYSEVLRKLFALAVKRKDAASLYRAAKALYVANPEDPPTMNNYAWLALLRGEDLAKAHELAERVYAKDPKVGAYASTYAYSLHLQGRTAEGLKALDAVPSATLNDPTVAGCYAFLLDAAGQSEKAADYYSIARRSPDLLPEEAQLFLEKRLRIDRSIEVPTLRLFSTELGGGARE